ncbi:hypothetical protein PSY31_23325, partial [Shigella flexneri]|nr:hypothetical protein [Shigella flexneri]
MDEYVILSIVLAFLAVAVLTWAFSPGGAAWKNGRKRLGATAIPGPCGLPVFGSLFALGCGLAHRTLAEMASGMK